MIKHRIVPLLLGVLLAIPVPAQTESAPATEDISTEDLLPYSRVIDVPDYGPMQYYAQNDPLWQNAVYEPFTTNRIRSFGSAGCGATSTAMAIAKQLPAEELVRLNDASRKEGYGFPYCVCSVNGHQCFLNHELITPSTPEEFAERLPTIIGSYSTGNNPRRKKYRSEEVGTSNQLFSAVAEAYGLQFKRVRDWETASQLIKEGWGAITSVTEGLFTSSSHYLFVAHTDDEWIYIFDPYLRKNYDELDEQHILEIVEPGLVRARLEDYEELELSTFYMIGPEIEAAVD